MTVGIIEDARMLHLRRSTSARAVQFVTCGGNFASAKVEVLGDAFGRSYDFGC